MHVQDMEHDEPPTNTCMRSKGPLCFHAEFQYNFKNVFQITLPQREAQTSKAINGVMQHVRAHIASLHSDSRNVHASIRVKTMTVMRHWTKTTPLGNDSWFPGNIGMLNEVQQRNRTSGLQQLNLPLLAGPLVVLRLDHHVILVVSLPTLRTG